MLCDNCKKNEATVHIKEFHNGQCETHHLCAECASKKEQQGDFGSLGFKLSEILFNPEKLEKFIHEKPENAEPDSIAVCPECSWTTAKIRESSGKVGWDISAAYSIWSMPISNSSQRAAAAMEQAVPTSA